MKTIQEIKDEKASRVDALITSCLVFFSFSNEQFQQNKTPLQEGEKYVSIGAGGYMPKGQVSNFHNGMSEIEKWYKEEIKANEARRDNIAYELNNHEAYYTGDITDTLAALGDDYTAEEVWAVYGKRQPTMYKEQHSRI